MYETQGLRSPAAMEMNSVPESLLPLDANTAGISRHSDMALNTVCLNAQVLESGSSHDFTDQVEGNIRTSREKISFCGRLRLDQYK